MVSAKLKCEILLQSISDATYIIIYHAPAIDGKDGKYGPFLRQQVDRNIIFPNY